MFGLTDEPADGGTKTFGIAIDVDIEPCDDRDGLDAAVDGEPLPHPLAGAGYGT